MSELRQQMIDAMRQRGYSVRTHEAYLGAVTDLAKYYRRSPDRLSTGEVKRYLRHIAVQRSLSGSTCRQRFHALRFFYQQVLGLERFEFSVPASLGRYIAPKGSVALDGVSLTVNEVMDNADGNTHFGVNIIPHTRQCTTFQMLKAGHRVNFEADMLARYVARLTAGR